jgi:hypothetical protein
MEARNSATSFTEQKSFQLVARSSSIAIRFLGSQRSYVFRQRLSISRIWINRFLDIWNVCQHDSRLGDRTGICLQSLFQENHQLLNRARLLFMPLLLQLKVVFPQLCGNTAGWTLYVGISKS